MIARVLAFAAALAPSFAIAAPADCIRVTALLSPASFRQYPAKSERGPWRKADVGGGVAHLFRTRLGEDSRGEPDFAGHFKIVRLGCGAGTVCPAVVDKATGQVHFVPEFRSVGWVPSDSLYAHDVERLTYRRDSRLLVLFGMRNEKERTSGVTLFDWRGGKPHLVRFVPSARLCQERAT